MVQRDFSRFGRTVLEIERDAIEGLFQSLGPAFDRACQILFDCQGKVIVTGMGKSGHIGGKIAATLASTGTPAFFVHPGEASHGDLGMITDRDVVVAISNSGETQEVLTLLPVLKRIGVATIAMTGKPDSTLARHSDVHLCVAVEKEACPLNLAPTASTTATLVMGDALAVALLHARGFTADDFALSHPGGSLGKRLLLRIEDLMHGGDQVPLVNEDILLRDALLEMTRKGLGMTAVVDGDGKLAGLFTDGDLRRVLDAGHDVRTVSIAQVMTKGGVTVGPDMLAAEALHLMEGKKINGLIVVDGNNRPIGALNTQDLMRAGVF
ncbi:KpsF/GutQ family sugar-phosphate isomerase [Gallaecimonas kandeliae]|uniref:KpsF/GutQ family sugar-phosphate isomerase n=1 Tax=Gallaecimonas kandeliae TaxID=3029055 RepID=UPI002649D756|nr:KpsF/GutQ family sugar-phosphate isomerase [Gallaecimonas kandeliae]WKE66053.1 KpsF/GutQ family sugar-phosphate isomerase [Gallaecimonas kandeliae]